jgi:pyruvate/2-oxoglutarate dehydrogenase complex dihydrolipoamide acyltransferase (E2) component
VSQPSQHSDSNEPGLIRVPKVGMSALDVEIVEVLVSPGDRVEAGQPVVEAASDKVDFTIEAEVAGTVRAVLVAAGDERPMGAVIVELDV